MKIKEVLKARIRRKDDPNYWETSRPLAWAGMRRRNSRDKPISKDVVYLDFRAELSAFDKYFYFGNLRNSRSRNKQEFLRRKSSSLLNLFEGRKQYINSSSRALNESVEYLTGQELRWISFVLGRKYTEGISVRHELFRNDGYSVLFRTGFAKYSEAVAGSGEMAVVRLVREILAAKDYSLILLDEPEVSLHPGAQNRLKVFLLEQVKLRKHQIVLTSHSPSIVNGLPKQAIKVFYQNQLRLIISDKTQLNHHLTSLEEINDTKQKFAFIADIVLGNSRSESISSVHKLFLQKWLNLHNSDLDEIKSTITSVINSA